MNAMTPTRVRLLLALAVIAAAVGWGSVVMVEGRTGRMIPVPWGAPLTIWLFAIALLGWTLLARPRLLRRAGHRPMSPFVAARTAALAMAASRTGSLVLGFYAGLAIAAIPYRTSPAGVASLWAAAITVMGALAMTVTAMWLERMCRLPLDGDDGVRSRAPKPRSEPGSVSARIGSSYERPDAT